METQAIVDTPRKSPQSWFKYAVWAAVILFIAFLGFGLRNVQAPQPIPGNPAPDVALSFYDGYEWNGQSDLNLSDLQGQVVVLNFWAGWCVPCQEEAAVLQNISQEYADKGVVFVGLAWSDTDSNALEFLEEYGVTYANAPDLQLNAGDAYRITGVPETFIIDRDGIIRYFRASVLTEPALRDMLNDVLGS